MKRTKQRADRAGQAKPEHTSGLRQFEGEDLSKYPHFALSDSVLVTQRGLFVALLPEWRMNWFSNAWARDHDLKTRGASIWMFLLVSFEFASTQIQVVLTVADWPDLF